MRNPPPISTSSPRLTITSRPAARAVEDEQDRGRAVVDDQRRLGSARPCQQTGGVVRPTAAGAAGPGRTRGSSSPHRVDTPSGARPRLVCSRTPVALITGPSRRRAASRADASARLVADAGSPSATPRRWRSGRRRRAADGGARWLTSARARRRPKAGGWQGPPSPPHYEASHYERAARRRRPTRGPAAPGRRQGAGSGSATTPCGCCADGSARVLDNYCPQSAGRSSTAREDGCVVCPWHGWAFDAEQRAGGGWSSVTFPVSVRTGLGAATAHGLRPTSPASSLTAKGSAETLSTVLRTFLRWFVVTVVCAIGVPLVVRRDHPRVAALPAAPRHAAERPSPGSCRSRAPCTTPTATSSRPSSSSTRASRCRRRTSPRSSRTRWWRRRTRTSTTRAVSIPAGRLRAFVRDLQGQGYLQGGSTITQQYVDLAYTGQQRTFTRKLRRGHPRLPAGPQAAEGRDPLPVSQRGLLRRRLLRRRRRQPRAISTSRCRISTSARRPCWSGSSPRPAAMSPAAIRSWPRTAARRSC